MRTERRWRGLALYASEFRVARVVLDYVAGLDPGAVRLAQALVALLPRRGATKRKLS